ncbi:hypothetical protein [Acinetobacter sp. Lyrl_1]|uniref:hypothetical protein n=1 Tax=Acinetobacter sp. Lyrl_1 TaxID=3110920 RepID=UPI003F7BF9CD
MIKFLSNQHTNFKLCSDFFREFKDEDLIWTTHLWVEDQRLPTTEYLDLLNRIHNFEELQDFLTKAFEKTRKENLERFIDQCQRKKIRYIAAQDINFLSKNNRLCWFIINQLENEFTTLKFKQYQYKNPYFLLIYLIQIELLDKKINIDEFRDFYKLLDSDKNPKRILKNYINDSNFINWSLDYTETQYSIETHPVFPAVSINEKIEKLYGYWDQQYSNNEYKYLHDINLLKKAWQQKQFREKGSLKKQYHLPLTKKTKSQLKTLAEKMDISESKVLENLVQEAFEKEMLDEKGKALY